MIHPAASTATDEGATRLADRPIHALPMKIRRNPDYEAAYVRSTDIDAPSPEELLIAERRRSVRLKAIAAAVAVLVVGGGIYAVVQARMDTPAKQAERGAAYGKNNNHVAAIIEFKRSLQEEPDQPAVRVMLGQELALMGDARGAQIEFQKAVDAGYQPDKTLPLLATSYLHQARFDKVIELVNNAKLDSAEGNAELLALRGSSYYALGRESEAQDSWKAANEFVPGNPPTVLAQARAFAAKGRYEDAAKALDGIGPDAPPVELLGLRGQIARALQKPLEAIDFYVAATKIEPGNLYVRENLGEAYVEVKQYDDAEKQIQRVLRATPNSANAHFIKAMIALGRNDLPAADEAAGMAVHLQPTDGRFQLLSGSLALQLGRRPEALQHLRDAVMLLPNNVEARRLLALTYIDRRDGPRADDAFAPVFANDPTNPDIASIAARIAVLRGRTGFAARAFDRVDPNNPKNVGADLAAASYKFANADKAGGFARLRAAQAADPNNAEVDVALVKAYLSFKDIPAAQTAWNTLAQKEANSSRTYNLRAAIELARGDTSAARKSLELAVTADPHAMPPVSGLAMLDLRDRKPEDAKNRLRRFIDANPSDADAKLKLVQLERENGNRQDVIAQLLGDALQANPKSTAVRYALINDNTARGDLKKAMAIADDGLALTPDDPQLLQYVGERALASGDNERAVAIFTKLVDADASSANFPLLLGLAQLASGNGEETLTAFRLALTRDPNNFDRQLTMVDAFTSAGKSDEASRMYYEVTRMSPKSPLLAELDADVKLSKKAYPEANAAYRTALAQHPSPRLVIKSYNAYMVALQRGEANNLLGDWLKAHPGDDAIRRFDADVAMRSKDYRRAANDFRLLAAKYPDDLRVLNNLAWNLAQINDPQAMSYAMKANAIAPNDAATSDTLGWLLVENGDSGKGLALIEKASLAAPDELDIRLHLAKAQIKEGRKDDARVTLQGLVAKAPSSEQGRASKALLATL
jgi:putative PEP-CTERM system TPR-repeat lipoprotein